MAKLAERLIDQLLEMTPGLRNAVSREGVKVCPACNRKIPRYPGRYPKNCPYCDDEHELEDIDEPDTKVSPG